MPTPTEHKPVRSRILKYAEAIDWAAVSQKEDEQRRGLPSDIQPANCAKNRAFLHELLTAKPRVNQLNYVPHTSQ